MLSPECRPIAAALFMSGAVRLHCDFYRLCEVLAEALERCPSASGLKYDPHNKISFLRVVELTLIQMHHEKFAEWNNAEGWFVVKRDKSVFGAFLTEIGRIPDFQANIGAFREAGKWIEKHIINDIPPVRPI